MASLLDLPRRSGVGGLFGEGGMTPQQAIRRRLRQREMLNILRIAYVIDAAETWWGDAWDAAETLRVCR